MTEGRLLCAYIPGQQTNVGIEDLGVHISKGLHFIRRRVVEYGIVRPAEPEFDESGESPYAQIVSTTFRTREDAEQERRLVLTYVSGPAIIAQRTAQGEWEEA